MVATSVQGERVRTSEKAGFKPLIFTVLATAAILVSVFIASGDEASAQGSIAQQELDAAEARWAEAGLASYQISYDTSCFCAPEGPSLFTIANGAVTAISSAIDSPYPATTGRTVEQMFADIAGALASNDQVTATYDPIDGHPLSYDIVYLDDNGVPYPDGFFGIKVFGLLPGTDAQICDGKPATIIGTDGDDNLQGSFYADVIMTFGGDDTVFGREGHDTICAGDGDDRVFGDIGAPIVSFAPVDQDDVILGGPGRDRLYGEGGSDRLLGGDDIDYLWGGLGADTLEGNGGSDRLRGGHDDDYLRGGSGADRMWGGDGDDEMLGQGGQDFMWGDAGDDVMQGNWQSDSLWGGDGDDIIGAAEGQDVVYGEAGVDTLYGGENSDVLSGGDGDDIVSGGRGTDELRGGGGADLLNGGPHTDTCYRGSGDVLLSCQQRIWELDDAWILVSGYFNPCRGAPGCLGIEDPIVPVAGSPVTMTLAGADVTGSGGCNSYFGSRAPEVPFRLDSPLISTEIGCPSDIARVEYLFFEALTDANDHELSGRTLRVFGPGGSLTFER